MKYLSRTMMSLSTAALISLATAQSFDPKLVIYTYPSLMGATNAVGDTYNFISAYANYSGLNISDILVFRVPSAELGVDATNYTLALNTTYAPDVVIGMDSAEEIATSHNWYSFNLTNQSLITSQLQNLYNLDKAKPFDYDLSAVIYDSVKYPGMGVYNHTFTLQSLLDNNTVSNLTVENPSLDTAGLDFLLWTVAEFGDPALNISSIYTDTNTSSAHADSWQSWWISAFAQGISIIESWDAAFTLFSDPTSNVSMMVSYGDDPAYNICQNYTNTIVPLVSHFNNTKYGYAAVEVMSIDVNTTHLNQSIDFVNWFFSTSNSDQIPTSQWSVPANSQVELPECFYEGDSIQPNSTVFYNGILANKTNLTQYVNVWVNEWLDLYDSFLSGNLTNTTSTKNVMSHKLKRMLQ